MNLPSKNKYTVAIIGLGYVGLPLAVEFSRNKRCKKTNQLLERKVIGFDINRERIKELINGFDSTKEVSKNELTSCNKLLLTSNKKNLENADVYIITVPTPINNDKTPNLDPIKNASKLVALSLKARSKKENINTPIIIYESTVFPGLIEEICVPLIEKESGLLYKKDDFQKNFVFGYSPERLNPGDNKHKLKDIIKITSGCDVETTNWIDQLYGSIIDKGTFKAKSIKIAEAAKVIENTQRDLNIALVNELSIIFKKLNIDTLDVLEAAETKWNFIPFKPGLVGGHCIGVDPYYLTYRSEQEGYFPKVVLSGRKVNDEMASWLAEQISSELSKRNKDICNSNVLIMGFSFKENCPDTRNTKVMDLYNSLQLYGAKVTVTDPWVDINTVKNIYGITVKNKTPILKYDAIILIVAHRQFTKLTEVDWKDISGENSLLFDLKGIIPRSLNPVRI